MRYKWTELEQKAFNYIKRDVSQNTLLSYPDFNTRFDIHIYARDYQLGAVIIQNGKPIVFYGQKLTGPQTMYTVTENELLSRVKTLKEFCTILLGQKLKNIPTIKI